MPPSVAVPTHSGVGKNVPTGGTPALCSLIAWHCDPSGFEAQAGRRGYDTARRTPACDVVSMTPARGQGSTGCSSPQRSAGGGGGYSRLRRGRRAIPMSTHTIKATSRLPCDTK